MRALLATALIAIGTSGCGIIFQSIAGWTEVSHARVEETHRLEVSSTPPGASITRTNHLGTTKALGPAPLVDEIGYEVDYAIESPRLWPLVVGGLLADLVGGFVLIGAIVAANPFPDDRDQKIGQTLGVLWGLGAIFVAAPVDLLTALIYGVTTDPIRTRTVDGDRTSYAYSARLDGHRERRATIRLLDEERLDFVLDPEAEDPDDPTMPGGPR